MDAQTTWIMEPHVKNRSSRHWYTRFGHQHVGTFPRQGGGYVGFWEVHFLSKLETKRALDLPAGGIFGRRHPLLAGGTLFCGQSRNRVQIASKWVLMNLKWLKIRVKIAQNRFKMAQSGVKMGQNRSKWPKVGSK